MIRRLYVEKRPGLDTAATRLATELRETLQIPQLRGMRLLVRYDIEGLQDRDFEPVREQVLRDAPRDRLFDSELVLAEGETAFAVEYLPGQFDQRADSTAQCIQLLTHGERPLVSTAEVYILQGGLSAADIERIKSYLVNPVDSRETGFALPDTLQPEIAEPQPVKSIEGFRAFNKKEFADLREEMGLAMSMADLQLCRDYYRDEAGREPTVTELRVLDTYWSDHCRHTTFLTRLEAVEIEDHSATLPIRAAYQHYLETRRSVYGERLKEKPICLMDLATLAMKHLRQSGKLDDLEVSEEINAASIVVPVTVDGETEEWLLQFKNETHNHPTEIEPFGGAATCVGGAIRDPLSGRAYVFQAMRVSGSADPRTPIAETIPGKLPQRLITREAARGFSSYGNQIGLATGQVREIYHPGYAAKRMEIGAVVAAVPRKQVQRGNPVAGDVILLVGGRTGRDGIGGATGSSKQHDSRALENAAEVQKGDAPTERKLQRLFRNPEAARLIVRCNDFGAGGVSVAIGELAPSLDIDLDAVPKKYAGLDGTELAISESQERMAVVLRSGDVDTFRQFAAMENLECVPVATVTESGSLRMRWQRQTVVDLKRSFLDTNGAPQTASARIRSPDTTASPLFVKEPEGIQWRELWLQQVSQLEHSGQRGLVEMFDASIGATTVLHPFGGQRQATPTEALAAMLPLLQGETTDGVLMAQGFDPALSSWSPFHGAAYAVLSAVCKIVATGGDWQRVRLSLQEYFPRLGDDPERWGMPLAALLGAYWAQQQLGLPAIGGKDSMSGSFNDLDVPPTLVAFAVCPFDVRSVNSPEFKQVGSRLVKLTCPRDAQGLPETEALTALFNTLAELNASGHVLAAATLDEGLAVTLSKMSFGNRLGVELEHAYTLSELITPDTGSFLLELKTDAPDRGEALGTVIHAPEIRLGGEALAIVDIQAAWEGTLQSTFPSRIQKSDTPIPDLPRGNAKPLQRRLPAVAQPRVCIPVFPGTNCEWDTARAFEKAGAVVDMPVFRNLTAHAIETSLHALEDSLQNSQILALPGGFSAGDEPDGSGKFIAAVFRNPRLSDAVQRLLQAQDGHILGICNGFQALIKLGLLPHGQIQTTTETDPTLTNNDIGRHVSRYVHTRVLPNGSPWLSQCQAETVYAIPVSHGEGKFLAPVEVMQALADSHQIACQYVDAEGRPTMAYPDNPNGSAWAIEGLTSADGRIFGKMGHSERCGPHVAVNIPGEKAQPIFAGGVAYYR